MFLQLFLCRKEKLQKRQVLVKQIFNTNLYPFIKNNHLVSFPLKKIINRNNLLKENL